MPVKYAILVPVFVVCSIALGIAQESTLLDLTQEPPPLRRRTSITGRISRPIPSHAPLPVYVQPVRVALTNLDAASYRLEQDMIVWELEVENLLDEPLVIPWSRDFDRIHPSDDSAPPGYVRASIGLQIRGEVPFPVTTVHASDLVPTSFKTLMPGESVRIRGSNLLYIPNRNVSDQLRTQLPLTVEVLGGYWLIDSSVDGRYRYDPAVSESGIMIEITN